MDLTDYDVLNHMPPGTPFRGPGAPLSPLGARAGGRRGRAPARRRPARAAPAAGIRDPLRQRLYRWAEALELWQRRAGDRLAARALPPRRGRGRRQLALHVSSRTAEVEVGVAAGRLFVATGDAGHRNGKPHACSARTVGRAFGVAPEDVDVRIGDSRLVRGPTSGGSRTTATLVPAALAAAARLREALARDRVAALAADARADDAASATRRCVLGRRARRGAGHRRRRRTPARRPRRLECREADGRRRAGGVAAAHGHAPSDAAGVGRGPRARCT